MMKTLFWLNGLATLTIVLVACTAAPGGLDATSWQLESYADDAGEMVDVLPRSVVTLNFQAKQVSGSAGCNNYNGSYQSTGGKIEFGPLATTRKMCAQPLGIMDQEDSYLAAMDASTEYALKANQLELKDDQGSVILVFTRATGD